MRRSLHSLFVLVMLAILLTGCSWHPLIPQSALRAANATQEPAMPLHVRPPVLGVDVYAATSYPNSKVTIYGTRALGYIKHGLNAQRVGFVWNLCSPGFKSNVVRRCAESLSATAVRELVAIARSDHLSVQLRPIIRVGRPANWNDPKKSWEGKIHPANKKKWLASLLAAELPYLRIARSAHVAQFVVATELQAFGYSRYWSGFLASAHNKCRCQVSYAANTQVYLHDRSSLPPVTAYGSDFYPAVNLPASASQRRVTAAWVASLAKVPASIRERTSLDEVSITAIAGAYRHPYNWNLPGRSDPMVQARWFTAACQTVARYHMRAVYFYHMPLADDPANPDPFPAFFIKNAGSQAIRHCRKIFAKRG